MRSVLFILAALALAVGGVHAADPAPGRPTGGEAYALPQWFKASFLDLRQDVEEARRQGRHVVLFMHLDECPYCARMLKESFAGGESREFIRKHFDVIGMNVRGDLEVTWADGTVYTERALARHLRSVATPTLVALGEDGKIALQLTGYRDWPALRLALEYVRTRGYRSQSFDAYLAAQQRPAVYALRDHPQFSRTTYFKGYAGPLAILFEDRYCSECAAFHDRTLSRPEVAAEMGKFLFVRLDAESAQPVVDLAGNRTTPAQWAKALGLTYRPGLVLFNEGREMYRADGRHYHFHLREILRYVSGAYYRQFDTLSAYRAAYRAELLKKGIDIDYSE